MAGENGNESKQTGKDTRAGDTGMEPQGKREKEEGTKDKGEKKR